MNSKRVGVRIGLFRDDHRRVSGWKSRAGYDPHAAATLWPEMINLEGGNSPPAFLSVRPSSKARLQALKALMPKMMPLYEGSRQERRQMIIRFRRYSPTRRRSASGSALSSSFDSAR
jgi:predicted Zn-dependent protease